MELKEFGQIIKQKYPQYADIDDVELANKVITKYPQYQSRVNSPANNKQGQKENPIIKAGNIAGKALETATKFTGIKSAIDLVGTAGEGIQYIGNKIWKNKQANQQLLDKPTSESMTKANEQGTIAGVKDVAGKSIEVAASAAPFAKGVGVALKTPAMIEGFATKFPTIARYSGYAATGAKYGGAFGASKGLQSNQDMKNVVKEAAQGATVGALVGVAIPAAIEGTVRAVKNVAALYSGVPKEALEQAFNNPEKVGQAARKYAKDPQATQEILTKANKGFNQIKKARSDTYQQALEGVESDIFVTKTGVNTGRLYVKDPVTGVFEPTKLTTKGVKDEFAKALKGFKNWDKILKKKEVSDVQELENVIYEWTDFSPLGLNDLKKAIWNRKSHLNSPELNKIYGKVWSNLDNYINTRAPQIGIMNAKYTKDTQFIESLQKELFGKRSTMSDNSKLNRLLGIFKQNSDVRKDLVKKLGEQAEIDLVNEITGAAMSSWLPTGWVQRFVLGGAGAGIGISALTNPAVIPAAAVGMAGASPRIVGKSARIMGQINRITPAIKKVGPAIINKALNQ